MHVHQIARSVHTTPDTVRYYTRIGLLRPRKDARNAYKRYSDDDQARLRFILCARQMDFSVDEISCILAQAEQSDEPCSDEIELIERRLQEARQRLCQTMSLIKCLDLALAECRSGAAEPTGRVLDSALRRFAQPELAERLG